MSVKLLVIDDDSAVTDLLSLLLRSHGFEVGATNNSTEGLSMIRDNSPDVVILDLMMPDMDGYEAMRIIRKTPGLKNARIVAVTAQAMRGDKEKCIEAGASYYIAKPINVDELLNYLENGDENN